MKQAPPMAAREDFVDVVGRSCFDWPVRPPALATVDQVPAEAFACLTNDSLRSTTATLRHMLQAAEQELATRQMRENAKRQDGWFALFLSKIEPVNAPRYASNSKEVEKLAGETILRSHPVDAGQCCLKAFGFEKVRRIKGKRNVYFYKFPFDCARPAFVQVVEHSRAGE